MLDILGYLGRSIGWVRGVRHLLQREKRIAGEDVGVSLENLKKLFEEQLEKETKPRKIQLLKDKLNEVKESLEDIARVEADIKHQGNRVTISFVKK